MSREHLDRDRLLRLLAELEQRLDRLEECAAAVRVEIRRHLRNNVLDPSTASLAERFGGKPTST